MLERGKMTLASSLSGGNIQVLMSPCSETVTVGVVSPQHSLNVQMLQLVYMHIYIVLDQVITLKFHVSNPKPIFCFLVPFLSFKNSLVKWIAVPSSGYKVALQADWTAVLLDEIQETFSEITKRTLIILN